MSCLLRWIFIRLQFSCACPVSNNNNCFLCLKCVFTMLHVAWKSDGSWWFVRSALLSPTPWLPSISDMTAPPRPISATRNKEKKERSGLQVKKEGRRATSQSNADIGWFFFSFHLCSYILTWRTTWQGTKKAGGLCGWGKEDGGAVLCSQDTWQPICTAPEKRSHRPGPCWWTASSLCSGSRCLARLRLFTLKISSP